MGEVGSDFGCPSCGNSSNKVVDSRPLPDRDGRRRRRECLTCGTRFDTYEVHLSELVVGDGGEMTAVGGELLPLINTIGVSAKRMKDLIAKHQRGGQR